MDMKDNLYTQIVRDLSETQEGREELFILVQGIILEKDTQEGEKLKKTLKKLCYLDAAIRTSRAGKINEGANHTFAIIHKKIAEAVNGCEEVMGQSRAKEEIYG